MKKQKKNSYRFNLSHPQREERCEANTGCPSTVKSTPLNLQRLKSTAKATGAVQPSTAGTSEQKNTNTNATRNARPTHGVVIQWSSRPPRPVKTIVTEQLLLRSWHERAKHMYDSPHQQKDGTSTQIGSYGDGGMDRGSKLENKSTRRDNRKSTTTFGERGRKAGRQSKAN